MGSNFFSGDKTTKGSTIAAGDIGTTVHQFTGSVFITSSAASLSASNAVSASSFWTPGGQLTPGGGGGGIAFDGSTANGVATYKSATTASVESNFRFDGSTNALSVTGTLYISSSDGVPIRVAQDADATMYLGNTLVGDGGSANTAYFGHIHCTGNVGQEFSVSQHSNLNTFINAPLSSNKIVFAAGGNTKSWMSGDTFYWNFGGGWSYTPSFMIDCSGSARIGTDSSMALYVTGAIDQSGSTSTFHIPDGNAGAFVISGSSDTGQGDPEDGLYFGVNTAAKAVRTSTDFIIDANKKLWLGTGSILSNPGQGEGNGYISYNKGEGRLVVESTSGSTNGICLSGAITAREIASGTLAGGSSYVGVSGDGLLVLTASSGGGGGSPAGSATSVQVNADGSNFGGDNYFTYDTNTGVMKLTGTFEHSGTLNLSTIEYGNKIVATLNPTIGAYDFNAHFAESSRFVVTGTTTLTSSAAVGTYPNWAGSNGVVLQCFGGTLSGTDAPPFIVQVTGTQWSGDQGYVGIGTGNPKVQLDVRWNPNLNTDEAGGDVVTFATGATTAGALYYLNDSGGWMSASADSTGSGNHQMLGIALGTDASSDGMLIRGFAEVSSFYTGSWMSGSAVYIQSASQPWDGNGPDDAGQMSGGAPTTADSYARIVGYATPNEATIYFNPGTSWIELS